MRLKLLRHPVVKGVATFAVDLCTEDLEGNVRPDRVSSKTRCTSLASPGAGVVIYSSRGFAEHAEEACHGRLVVEGTVDEAVEVNHRQCFHLCIRCEQRVAEHSSERRHEGVHVILWLSAANSLFDMNNVAAVRPPRSCNVRLTRGFIGGVDESS
jgi:hypothetical protein